MKAKWRSYGILAWLWTGVLAVQAQVVSFPDAGLEKAVRLSLGKPTGELTVGDLATLTNLSDTATGRGIRQLDGLEAAVNLQTLELRNNALTSVVVSREWSRLEWLSLADNLVTNLEWEAVPVGLLNLDLRRNRLEAFALPEGLTHLTYLVLASNRLDQVTLPPDLVSLEMLALPDNRLTIYTVPTNLPALLALYLDGNPLSNLVVGPAGPQLLELYLGRTALHDLALLHETPNLVTLSLAGPPGMDLTAAGGLGVLGSLTNLHRLDLSRNELTNTPFDSLPSTLEYLELNGNELSSLSLPSGLDRLRHLQLSRNRMRDLSFLSQISGPGAEVSLDLNEMESAELPAGAGSVGMLHLDSNRLRSLVVPAGYHQLTLLSASENQLTNLTLAADLRSLRVLFGENNQLRRVDVPGTLGQLTELDFRRNPLVDLRLGEGLGQLSSLQISDSPIQSLTLPSGLTNLGAVFTWNTALTTMVVAEDASPILRQQLESERQFGLDLHYYPLQARLDPPRWEHGQPALELHAPPGRYQIMVSDDLREWRPAGEAVNRTGNTVLVDRGAPPTPSRFFQVYRYGPVDP